MRNFFSQSVFVIISKINEKNLILSLPLSFSLSGKKVYKYIARALLFLILSTKIIVFSILLILFIFDNIRKLRSSKLKFMIGIIVYMIFG